MITFIEGILEEKNPTRVVVNVGGVGYEIFIPMCCYENLPAAGQRCRLLVHDHIREDQHSLFGFLTHDERAAFEMMMSVSGIGARLALSALSCLSVRDIKTAILNSDVKTLSSISGVGKKTAERMLVELRDRVGKEFEGIPAAESTSGAFYGDNQTAADAALAMVSLGYKPADARRMIQAAMDKLGDAASVEELVRFTLRGGK